jgi:hypothetical protein
MKKVKAYNIKYDTDGDLEIEKQLPKEMEFDAILFADREYLEEDLADFISGQTGVLVESFDIEWIDDP